MEELVHELLADAAPSLRQPIGDRDRRVELHACLGAFRPDDGAGYAETCPAEPYSRSHYRQRGRLNQRTGPRDVADAHWGDGSAVRVKRCHDEDIIA